MIDFDKFRFGTGQGDTAVGYPALDRVTKWRPSDDVDFGVGDEAEVEEALADGAGCMMTLDLGPTA